MLNHLESNTMLHYTIKPPYCGCTLQVFDLRDGQPVDRYHVAADTVNGCNFHPLLPLLATASGQRRYPLQPEDSDMEQQVLKHGMMQSFTSEQAAMDEEVAAVNSVRGMGAFCNALRVWRLVQEWVDLPDGGATQGDVGMMLDNVLTAESQTLVNAEVVEAVAADQTNGIAVMIEQAAVADAAGLHAMPVPVVHVPVDADL